MAYIHLTLEDRCSIHLQAQPSALTIEYRATVELRPEANQTRHRYELRHAVLPEEILAYLNPSRSSGSNLKNAV